MHYKFSMALQLPSCPSLNRRTSSSPWANASMLPITDHDTDHTRFAHLSSVAFSHPFPPRLNVQMMTVLSSEQEAMTPTLAWAGAGAHDTSRTQSRCPSKVLTLTGSPFEGSKFQIQTALSQPQVTKVRFFSPTVADLHHDTA